jgi:hypothetical protein
VSGGAAAGGGRSEVKRSRAGPSHGEPRTESPSEAAQPKGDPAQRGAAAALFLKPIADPAETQTARRRFPRAVWIASLGAERAYFLPRFSFRIFSTEDCADLRSSTLNR